MWSNSLVLVICLLIVGATQVLISVMELTCKICQNKFSLVRSFVIHFNLTHRLSSSARFTCGVESCLVRFRSEDRFESHLRDCHTSPQSSLPTDKESSGQFVCPISNCNYTCNVKSTMRVHRKRKHGQDSCMGSAVKEPHNVLFETADLDLSEVSDSVVQYPTNSDNSAEETINNIIFPEQEIDCRVSRQDVLQNVVHFYMSLNSKYHVPDSTIQYMINTFCSLTSVSNNILKEDILSSLKVANIEIDQQIENAITSALSNNILLELHDPKGPLRSYYMRQKTYKSGMFKYVAPKSHKLGLNDLNEKRRYHIISVKASIMAMFEDDSVYEQYVQSQNSDCSGDGFVRDINDGTFLKNHPVLSKDKSAIGILLDADDLEIASALGSARGKHKVTAVYYTLSNFLPWSRMKQDVIRLCMVVAEKDVAYFGLETVLKPLITELNELAETGIEIRGKTVKVVLALFLGDNLGTHTWTGLVENFSRSKYFCRYCEESREEWCMRWHGSADDEDSDSDVLSSSGSEESDSSDNESCQEDEEVEVVRESSTNVSLDLGRWKNAPMPSAPLRTPQSVDLCLAELQSKKSLDSVKGVVGPCQLNNLKDFHWVGASPCCFAHDWFEGVLSHDCALALQYFKKRFGLEASFINSKIKSLKLLGSDQGNKPAKVKDGMKKLRGSAVQNWNFLRFLPFFVASKITDTNDGVWQMVLCMTDLTRFLSSPTACRSELPRLKQKYHLYLKMRCFHFPNVGLRCKHHYLEHAVEMIECFGCLMRYNTLGFESKHRFLKNTALAKKNYKNVSKILTEEHQLAQSAITVENLMCNYPVVEDASPLVTMCTAIKQSAIAFFGEEFFPLLTCSDKVRFHGTWYKKGELIVLNETSYQFCLIEVLLVQGKNCYAVGWLCKGVFNQWQLVEVTRTTNCTTVNLGRLNDYVSYPLYSMKGREVVVLKHATKLLD